MAKKRKYKKVFKGTRYIAQKLKKYRKRQYPTYTSALPKAREILGKIESSGEKVTVANIRKYSKVRPSKTQPKPTGKPDLMPYLTIPTPAYQLNRYPSQIEESDEGIVIKSTISPEGKNIFNTGEQTDVNYSENFKSYVDWCNAKRKDLPEDSYTTDFFVVCTPVEFENGQWTTTIISCDSEGNPQDYGFSKTVLAPKTTPPPKSEPKEIGTSKPKKTTSKQEPKSEPIKFSDEVLLEQEKTKQAEAKAESDKAKALDRAMELYSSGKISESTFNKIISKL